jgi:hypothetical protein
LTAMFAQITIRTIIFKFPSEAHKITALGVNIEL